MTDDLQPTVHDLAHGRDDGKPIHPGDRVMIEAEVLRSRAGMGLQVRLFSTSGELELWITERHLRWAIIDLLPAEPADGTWLLVDGSLREDRRPLIFHRSDREGRNDPARRHDQHWWDVVAQEWIDWPAAVIRGAGQSGVRRMHVEGDESV